MNSDSNYSRKLIWATGKIQQIYLGEKEEEAITAIRNTVHQDAENLEVVSVLELNSEKHSIKDQELANWNKTYDVAIHIKRQFCVTIKKYNFNKPPSLHSDSILRCKRERNNERICPY